MNKTSDKNISPQSKEVLFPSHLSWFTCFTFECCNFYTLFSDFSSFWHPASDMYITCLPVNNIPFFHIFFIADGVHVSMEITPLGRYPSYLCTVTSIRSFNIGTVPIMWTWILCTFIDICAMVLVSGQRQTRWTGTVIASIRVMASVLAFSVVAMALVQIWK